MNVFLSLWVLIVCMICMTQAASKRNKICYKAKTCIHNGVEKCGVDGNGNLRRFFDSCDLLEFNCLKGKDYVKTAMDKCSSLPAIEDAPTPHKKHELIEEKTPIEDREPLDDQESVHDQEEPEEQESLIDQEASDDQGSLNDQEAPHDQESLNDSGSDHENQVTSNNVEEVHELADRESVKNDELQEDEEVSAK